MKTLAKIVTLIILGIIVSLPATVFAYDGIVTDYIADLRVRPSDGTDTGILVAHDTMANPGNCSGTTWYKLVLDGTERPQALYKTILLAATMDYEIKFELTGCSDGGTDGSPVITGAWIEF